MVKLWGMQDLLTFPSMHTYRRSPLKLRHIAEENEELGVFFQNNAMTKDDKGADYTTEGDSWVGYRLVFACAE